MISAPPIPGLVIYRCPELGETYVCGADSALGNPTSDDSSMIFFHVFSGEEVAALTGKIEPSVFASYINDICAWFNYASAMVEANSHGLVVVKWLQENSRITLLCGPDGKPGWTTSFKSKTLLFDQAADAFRNEEVTIHSFETLCQLMSIEGSTMKAPEGEHDDRAMAAVLGIAGILQCSSRGDPQEAMALGHRNDPMLTNQAGQRLLGYSSEPCEAMVLGTWRRP